MHMEGFTKFDFYLERAILESSLPALPHKTGAGKVGTDVERNDAQPTKCLDNRRLHSLDSGACDNTEWTKFAAPLVFEQRGRPGWGPELPRSARKPRPPTAPSRPSSQPSGKHCHSARRHRTSTPVQLSGQVPAALSPMPPSSPNRTAVPRHSLETARRQSAEVQASSPWHHQLTTPRPKSALGGNYVKSFTEAYGDILKRKQLQATLGNAFTEMTHGNSEHLSVEHFRMGLQKDRIKRIFSEFGVQPHLAGHVFRLVDTSGTGRCDKKDFVEGFVKYAFEFWESGEEFDLDMLEEMLLTRGQTRCIGNKAVKKPG
mmetsp:Transcript_136229/g.240786  ORF Transcript_136229/g.240786 Transcript_136229/m.240786 type:complete len:316 (+) Transcript_136229:74-1021(+)